METLAIIRPKKQLEESKKIVEAFGYRALGTTMIDVTPLRDLRWPDFLDELRSGKVDYVIITSANGAHICGTLGLNASAILPSTEIVAIGPQTRAALLKEHLRVDLMPSEYSTRGLVKMFGNIEKKSVWILRSAFGSPELLEGLANAGASVHEIVLYTLKKLCGPPQQAFVREVAEGTVAGVLFTSAMTVRAFFDCATRTSMQELTEARLGEIVVGAIGAPTAEALSEMNVQVDVIPSKATFRELVSTVHSTLSARVP
jgi:uroporphyrinogen-III synthase